MPLRSVTVDTKCKCGMPIKLVLSNKIPPKGYCSDLYFEAMIETSRKYGLEHCPHLPPKVKPDGQ